MKIKSIIFFYILSISFATDCQTGIIIYKVSPLEKKESELATKIQKEQELMEFQLSYNSEKSFFKLLKYIPIDELYSKIAATLSGADEDFFQNTVNKTSLYNKTVNNKTYKVNHSYKMNNWELTNENIVINNYVCYKAILKEYNDKTEQYFNTTAWYTPDIPIGYGPIGYGGLPGVILHLQFNNNVFTATDIVLNPKKTDIKTISEGKLVTVKEIVKLMRAARKVTED